MSIFQPAPSDGYAEVNTEDVDTSGVADNEEGNPAETDTRPSSPVHLVYRFHRLIRRFFSRYWTIIKQVVLLVLLLGYLAYFSYCMYYKFGDEPSIRLLVGTVIGLLIILRYYLKRFVTCPWTMSVWKHFDESTKRGRRLRMIVRWCVLTALSIFARTIIIVIIIIIIYPLAARVVGAPQMISQPVSSIFLCSPLPSGTWQTPGLAIP